MVVQPKPIPALYTVYILRSSVRHSSLYIGSTPNPPRRLSQHNGKVIGGAARTARPSLRPWEMVGLVSGFPSMTAALRFEWALTNPHISLHIPTGSRISFSTQRKRNGQLKRPSKSLSSILQNLHLLLRVPSFDRWPLKVHFFAPEVYSAWQKWCATEPEKLRDTLEVTTDFDPNPPPSASPKQPTLKTKKQVEDEQDTTPREKWGIETLPVDYKPMKEYVEKAKEVFEFERQGNCIVCHETMEPGEGLYVICPNTECEGVGHLSCWSRHLLPGQENDTDGEGEDDDDILPIRGKCPKCTGDVHWIDMMKELTLRQRGEQEVEKLLKKRKPRATKSKAKADSDSDES
ncbi:hypothetical protein QBC35DRAFT_494372 [Podospora australis]|uniref:GIY-YIG domain-containing protein n=1 Tax=Podospora australis TaxID=1536484 RepID=A0AAN6WWX1_9PEZI|nr:hypothetical protein QBC35DRAFT_494372 [Podospora australis]